jgi:hypothetical protein
VKNKVPTTRATIGLILGIAVVGVTELVHALGDRIPGGSLGRSLVAGAIVGMLAMLLFKYLCKSQS